jgi:GGDEF domain-containing protein
MHAKDDDEALEAGQRLRRAVLDSGANVTVSIGVALSGPGEDANRIVARADRALYAVKAAGRDGVALAEPDAMAESLMP